MKFSLITMLFLCVTVSQASYACRGPFLPRLSVQDGFARHDIVFLGEALEEQQDNFINNGAMAGSKVYRSSATLKVLHSWKGKENGVIKLSEKWSTDTCGRIGRLSMSRGEKYLVFVKCDEGICTLGSVFQGTRFYYRADELCRDKKLRKTLDKLSNKPIPDSLVTCDKQ